MNTHTIEAAKHYIHEIFKDNSDGHDEQHSLRVYRNALKIAENYPECNKRILAEFHKETEPCSEQIRRIEKYEKIMREAGRIIEGFSKGEEEILRDLTNELESYYGSDEWKQDFADDEAGLLPAKLARGVLSEDGIYNLLERSKELLHSKTSFPKYSGQ